MSKGFEVYALHGDLEPRAQDKILSKSSGRKVIVSTNVAETSLTIEGVKYVIDSGLAKVARFDPARGVNTLLVERVSLASATQRAGRAGRTSPGVAVRLWRQNDEISFDKYNTPEISRLDLSQIILWLAARGLKIENLKLFEKPPEESVERAKLRCKALAQWAPMAELPETVWLWPLSRRSLGTRSYLLRAQGADAFGKPP